MGGEEAATNAQSHAILDPPNGGEIAIATEVQTSDMQLPGSGEHTTHDARPLSPSSIKQETITTPQPSSPGANHTGEVHMPKAVTALKTEPSMRLSSPLRESSVTALSTELTTPEQPNSKKRPAPTRAKKGTATASKAPATKKRKIEQKRSSTPSSVRVSKAAGLKQGGVKGTPANSSPASSPARSNSLEPRDDSEDEDEDFEGEIDDDNLYCVCRKPDTGTFMIGCDGTCDDWFHGKCVGIDERNKNLIDKYMCPRCTQAGIGVTLWKRMCRRQGCRQPARVARVKKESHGSKYCSDECGVLYFRSLAAKSRNSEDWSKSRGSRRRTELMTLPAPDRDLGARGGLLSGPEVKWLLQSSSNLEDFQSLGQGVLSPPATPQDDDKGVLRGLTDESHSTEDVEALERIGKLKEEARGRHQLLKDRMRFITMAKQAATRIAAEKDLKPKEYCGYDPRIEWTDEQFLAWRNSDEGKQTFDTGSLDGSSITKGSDVENAEADKSLMAVCTRKKCARHLEWGKLSVDDVRFEMADNSDKMRGYDRDEQDVRRRAALRLNSGSNDDVGHTVEMHGPESQNQSRNQSQNQSHNENQSQERVPAAE